MKIFFEVTSGVWFELRNVDPWIGSGNAGQTSESVALGVSRPTWDHRLRPPGTCRPQESRQVFIYAALPFNSSIGVAVMQSLSITAARHSTSRLDATACVGRTVDDQVQRLVYRARSLLGACRGTSCHFYSTSIFMYTHITSHRSPCNAWLNLLCRPCKNTVFCWLELDGLDKRGGWGGGVVTEAQTIDRLSEGAPCKIETACGWIWRRSGRKAISGSRGVMKINP